LDFLPDFLSVRVRVTWATTVTPGNLIQRSALTMIRIERTVWRPWLSSVKRRCLTAAQGSARQALTSPG